MARTGVDCIYDCGVEGQRAGFWEEERGGCEGCAEEGGERVEVG